MDEGWSSSTFLHVIQHCGDDCEYRISQRGRINPPLLPSRWRTTWIFFAWLCFPPAPHLISSELLFLMASPNWNILVLQSFSPSALVHIYMRILALLWVFWGPCWRWVWKPHAAISYSSPPGTCLPTSVWSWHCCSPPGEAGKEDSNPRGFWTRTWLVLLPVVI